MLCWVTDGRTFGKMWSERPSVSLYVRLVQVRISAELLRTNVYSAFHPSGVSKWVPAVAGKAKAGTAHSDCGCTSGCAGITVKSLENTCHTWALLRWWFTTKSHYYQVNAPLPLLTLTFTYFTGLIPGDCTVQRCAVDCRPWRWLCGISWSCVVGWRWKHEAGSRDADPQYGAEAGAKFRDSSAQLYDRWRRCRSPGRVRSHSAGNRWRTRNFW